MTLPAQRFFYDFEFIEHDDFATEPISVGVIAQDGTTYYAVFDDIQQEPLASRIFRHGWLRANVLNQLPIAHQYADITSWNAATTVQKKHVPPFTLNRRDDAVRPRWVIRRDLLNFFTRYTDLGPIELWADCGSADHQLLTALWGFAEGDRPEWMPWHTNDLRQLATGRPFPQRPTRIGEHHALDDAIWARTCWGQLRRETRREHEASIYTAATTTKYPGTIYVMHDCGYPTLTMPGDIGPLHCVGCDKHEPADAWRTLWVLEGPTNDEQP